MSNYCNYDKIEYIVFIKKNPKIDKMTKFYT